MVQLNIRTALEVTAFPNPSFFTIERMTFYFGRLQALQRCFQMHIGPMNVLQEQERPDINIVCEKVAFQGLTRFEDRNSLPLGVSSNFTAYSAKLLTQASKARTIAAWPGKPVGFIAFRMCLHYVTFFNFCPFCSACHRII